MAPLLVPPQQAIPSKLLFFHSVFMTCIHTMQQASEYATFSPHSTFLRACITSVAPSLPKVAPEEPICHETDFIDFSLFQCYKEWPSIDPSDQLELNKIADAPIFVPHVSKTNTSKNQCKASLNPFYPFINMTIFWLFAWFYQSTSKFLSDITSLVHNIICAPDFNPDYFVDNFDAAKVVTVFNKVDDSGLSFSSSCSWYETLVTIKLPQTAVENVSEMRCQSLKWQVFITVISVFQDTSFFDMHLKRFTEMWKPGNGQVSEQVFGEAYTLDIYFAMKDEISSLASDDLETVVIPLMGYSDSMHLVLLHSGLSIWPSAFS